jgi:hypothetical protein
LTFFNAHYDTWCYLQVAGFLTLDHDPEQYLFTYVLLTAAAYVLMASLQAQPHIVTLNLPRFGV